jgi:beta-lactamase regulating signal transducer with metallopeptidase domain
MTMLTLITESSIRSLALGATVWIGMKAARVRNTQAQITAWTLVLAASIAMPALMRWPTVTIPAPLPRVLPAARSIAFVTSPIQAAPRQVAIDWQGVLGSCYLAGTILLLLRMAAGLALTGRLRRTSVPVPPDWQISRDVRRSEGIAAPATFGSTILLPADCVDWTPAVRQAVLTHEQSHVEHGDFYIQLLASAYRALFWFSPLAWYLRKQLAELAETRSDDAAIANFPDRPSYAEILLGFAKRVQRMPLAVAMARPATVTRRVDRILAGTPVSPALNWRRRALLTASVLPLIALAAGCSLHVRAQNPVQTKAQTPTASALVEGDRITFDHDQKPYYVDDPTTVAAATNLFHEQEELGREQAELGELQEALGERQAQVSLRPPDLTAELDSLRMQMKLLRDQFKNSANQDFRQEEFGDLQAQVGDLQAKLSDMLNRIGEQQARLGDAQAALGQQQADLGERQARLGDQQARAAGEATKRMLMLLDEALRKGLARPVE